MNLNKLKNSVDKDTYVRVRIGHPEESIRIRGFFNDLGQPYNTVMEGDYLVVTKGKF